MYRRLNLTPDTLPTRPASIPAGAPTDVEVAHATLRGLDTVLGSARRVLLEAGLQGAPRFLVPSGEPVESPTRSYPDTSTPRTVAQALGVPLTPGHVVELEVVALPSGPTQVQDENDLAFVEDSRGGQVELLVTYRNATGEISFRGELVELEGSDELGGTEPGDPWEALETKAVIVLSGPILPDAEAWAKWTGIGVTVDLTLRYRGSPRVVDVVVAERPWACVVDSSSPRRPAALYTDLDGDPLASPASDYPIIHLDAGDRALGTRSIVEAIRETGASLGPVLWSWSAHRESSPLAHVIEYDGGSGDGAPVPWLVVGSDWASLSLPLGTFAQGVTQSSVLDGRSGVLPVWVIVCWRTSGAPGFLEVRSGDGWELVELRTDSTEWTWTTVPGWVEVGVDASTIGEYRVRSSTESDRVELRYVSICYCSK